MGDETSYPMDLYRVVVCSRGRAAVGGGDPSGGAKDR